MKILSGKDRGKYGKVIQIFSRHGKAVIEGLNMSVKHLRAQRRGDKGQKIEYPGPIDMSNLMVVCPKCDKPSRVGYEVSNTDDGKKSKVRKCKKCKGMM